MRFLPSFIIPHSPFRIFALYLFLIFIFSTPCIAKSWDPRLLQAPDLAYSGKFLEARKLLDQYIREHPKDPNGYILKGTTYDWEVALTTKAMGPLRDKTLKNYKIANELAQKAYHKNRTNVSRLIDLGNSYLFLGRIYSEQGRWLKAILTAKKARKPLEKAYRLNPQRVEGLMALGVFHYMADNTPRSAAPFKALFGIKGSKTEGLKELKTSLTKTHPFRNDALMALYHLNLYHEKNYQESQKYLSELESKFPQNPFLKYLKAELHQRQDYRQGLVEYLKLMHWCQQQGGSCSKKFQFLTNYRAGILAQSLGQTKQAKNYLRTALKLNPKQEANKTALTHYHLGQIYQAENQNSKAINRYSQAKSIKKISKKVKKRIQQSIQQLCKADKKLERC